MASLTATGRWIVTLSKPGVGVDSSVAVGPGVMSSVAVGSGVMGVGSSVPGVGSFYLFSAQKTRGGQIVCMTQQGRVLELDARTGRLVRSVQVATGGNWCGAEALANGRFLVTLMNQNQVVEIDAQGKTHWSAAFAGVHAATRLPNGHTLVASMNTRRVAELDRTGRPVWQRACEGRPWRIHYR